MIITSRPKASMDSCSARLATTADRSKLLWHYDSIKNGCYVSCASPDTLRAVYHAEVSHDVLRYRTQLEPLRLKIGGQPKTYMPHLEETLLDGGVIVTEITDMFEEGGDHEHAEAVAQARAYYAARGIGFRIRDRSKIAEQSILDAVEAIQTFRRTAVTTDDVARVKVAFGERHYAPLADIRDIFKSPALGFAKLSAMMVRRIVAIDLTRELGPASQVRLLDLN